MHTLPLQALCCTFPVLICLAQSVGQAGCLKPGPVCFCKLLLY